MSKKDESEHLCKDCKKPVAPGTEQCWSCRPKEHSIDRIKRENEEAGIDLEDAIAYEVERIRANGEEPDEDAIRLVFTQWVDGGFSLMKTKSGCITIDKSRPRKGGGVWGEPVAEEGKEGIPADLKEKATKEIARMAEEGKKSMEAREAGKAAADEDAGSLSRALILKTRDACLTKKHKELVDARFSRGKTQFGKAVVNQTKFDDAAMEIYFQHLSLNGRKGEAAKAAGVSPSHVFRMQQDSEEFAAWTDAAMQFFRDYLLGEIEHWGVHGIVVEEFDKDGNPRKRVQRSEKMMELLARIHFKELRKDTQTNVAVGVKMPEITINVTPRKKHHD